MMPTNLQAVTVADMLRAVVEWSCCCANALYCSRELQVFVGGCCYQSSRATRRSQLSWSSIVVTSSPRLA
jgi:hypothetical protein